jgi:hypothetical protein
LMCVLSIPMVPAFFVANWRETKCKLVNIIAFLIYVICLILILI